MVTTPSMSFSELLVTGYKTKYVVNIVTHFIPKWENLYFSFCVGRTLKYISVFYTFLGLGKVSGPFCWKT